MALSIRSRSVEEKARRYAALRRTTVTGAIEHALDRSLRDEAIEKERRIEEFRALVKEIQDEVAKMPILDDRSPDEILGYDENGLPT